MITRELLQKEIQQLTAQRDNALAVAQQAVGAIALAEHLLKQLSETDALTLPELATALGAKSAEIVEHPNG